MASDSQAPTVMAVSIVFGIITAIVMVVRLWARIFLVKHMGIDDILICIAALLAWSFMIVTIIAVQHGLGDHIDNALAREHNDLTAYSEAVWLSSIFYNATLGFIKISVLTFYTRLGDRTLRRLAIVMVGVVSCQAGGNVMACIFQCSPVAAAYDQTITNKHCIDLLTYTLPIKLIINLQVPHRQKIGLGVILCLGLFACISSIIRITFIPQMLVAADTTYVISGAMYWSVIELNIGILAASIPSFKPVASRYAPRLLGSSYNKSNNNPKGSSSYLKSSSNGGFRSSGLGRGRDGTMELHSVERGDCFEMQSNANRTEIGKGSGTITMGKSVLDDNSSEEALCTLPQGRIGVETQIETRYDQR